MSDKRRIVGAFCLWCDLLGFSTPFVESEWDLGTEASIRNLNRIEKLQHSFTNVLFYPIERVLVLNDGFVRTVDLVETQGQPQSYLYWLNNMLNSYMHLNYIDKRDGFPGARAVLTFGYRYQYMKSNVTAADIVQTSIERKKKLETKVLVYSPVEFQMNTAFSKAYIIEGAGTKAGISGSNLYIDIEFLKYMEHVLTSDKNAKYLLAGEVDEVPDEKGWHKSIITELKVDFEVKSYTNEENFIWDVIEISNGEKKLLFRLWLDKYGVQFNQKGINTILYKANKYKPYDEDDFVIEL